jgi:uncharacterized protein YjiK
MDEFQNGIRAYHNTEYERAITFFIKSLGYNEDNQLARYFLGESYRKAGYDKNAIFVWNNLLSLGYKERSLRSKIEYIYNKRGMLHEININKTFVLREDIKGYYQDTVSPLFIKPSQISIGNNNHYYIASFLTGLVVELDPNFNLVKNHFPLIEKIKKPFGIVVDKEGFLYVSDFENNVVVKFDKFGVIKSKIGFKGISKGALLGPEYLLIDDEDNLYVVDSGNHRINKYKKDGDVLFSFGTENGSDGKLEKPAGLYYYNNNIYVCDKGRDEVIVYDKSGNYISSFGKGKLKNPYDITRDNFNRFIILCEKEIWIYEEENSLWYILDAVGNRLERGISIAMDKENNLLVSDFNSSRLLVLSHERERYVNLNINIERVFYQSFPDVHLALTVEKDDFTTPSGIDESNVTIFENGKMVPLVGTIYTKERDKRTDIIIIYDNNIGMAQYKNDIKIVIDNWLKNINSMTTVGLVAFKGGDAVLLNELGSARLSILDSIDNCEYENRTDKSSAIKFSAYHMLKRFSKKAIILITNSKETGNDFEKFKIENSISLIENNNVPINIVSFHEGQLSEIYKYLSIKSDGEYYRAYNRGDLKDLIKKIENKKGKEIIFSYSSNAVSRFGDEPISVTVEVNYGGMNGVSKTIYYPARYK